MRRILFLVSSMRGGGAERVASLLCNRWVGKGYEVTLLATYSGRGECVYSLDPRVNLRFLVDSAGSQSKSFLGKVLRFVALRRVIRELDPDVILSFMSYVNVAALVASCGLSKRVVVSERSYPPLCPVGPLLGFARKWTYRHASAIVMQTGKGREWAQQFFPSRLIEVIPNPVVQPLPRENPCISPDNVLDRKRNVLLAVGRLAPEKGMDRVIDAFSSLVERFPDWDLVILGEGGERRRLEQKCLGLGLSERVRMPGRVGNLQDWYERAALYVMASHYEGFPNSMLEAMAHGLPVVSVDCDTGPRDLVCSGVEGILVDPDEGASGLADALGLLMEDGECRRRMGEAASAVRDQLSIARIGAMWDRVLGLY